MRGRLNRGKICLIIIGGLIISSAFLIGRVFVYDTNVAHPGLIKLAGELYNNQIVGTGRDLSLSPLTSQEINWLMQGAIEEDTPLRWMNHFYDPIYNRGFKGGYDTAKAWATDANNQTMFSKGDQSWQRAMYEFQQGNKKKAFIALGHVLHLLEDMTVPAHTRDDAHVEGDPYEQWVKNNFKPVSSQLIYYNMLNQYFDYLAKYSNRNFYSEDTIKNNKFGIIQISKEELKKTTTNNYFTFFYTQSGDAGHLLFFSKKPKTDWRDSISSNKNEEPKYYSVNDPSINFDYFSLLAPKAVGAGAGVIKLFFEEVAKQKVENPTWLWQTNPLGYLQEPVGWVVAKLEPLVDKAKNLVIDLGSITSKVDFISELFKDSLALAQGMPSIASQEVLSAIESLMPTADLPNIASQLPLAQPKFSENQSPKPPTLPIPSAPISQSANVSFEEAKEDLLAGFVSTPSVTTPYSPPSKGGEDKAVPLLVTQPVIYGGSSYSSVSSASANTQTAPESPPPDASPEDGAPEEDKTPPPPLPPPDTTPPTAPIFIQPLTSPVWTSQTTTTLSAELSSDTYKIFFNDAEEIVSSTLWLQEVDLLEGKNIFEMAAADLAGNISATSSVKIIRDTTAPLAAIQGTKNKEQETKIDLVWSGDDDGGAGLAFYDVEYQKSEIGSASSSEWLAWQMATTSTQAVFSGETGYQYQFRVRAADQLGNLGEWAVSETQNLELPRVVINEVAWGGTVAVANDEWLELYNNENYTVNLNGWFFTDGNDINVIFATSSFIGPKSFYLLERTSDETIKDIFAEMIYTGALKDSGEKLILKNNQGQIIDEVDAGLKWFAGQKTNNRETMERKDPLSPGNLANNWQTTPLPPRNGFDAKGNPINGTPKRPNSPFTYLDGLLNQDRMISNVFNPYFLGNLTVSSGTLLTFGPGTIVKAGSPTGGGNLFVYGTIKSQGTADQPVVFTSYRDSSYAGQTNTWSSLPTPAGGDWNRLYLYAGSQADLQNTKILYGNYRSLASDPNGAMIVSGGEANLSDLTVAYSRPTAGDAAIHLDHASTTLANCLILDNATGLLINSSTTTIAKSIFEKNGTSIDANQNSQLSIQENIFKDNGFKSGSQGLAKIRDSNLSSKNNQFQNNSLNGFDWGGTLSGQLIIDNKDDWPWVSSGFIVANDAYLTLKAGSRIKLKENALIMINGALQAEGTAESPVVFTSYHDDNDGFDSDSGPQQPNPTGLEWYQLRFESSATSSLNYLTVRYANQHSWVSDPAGSVYINQTPVMADHLQIEYGRVPDAALHLKNATAVSISNSLIKNQSKKFGQNSTGILIDAGAPIISDSTIDTFNYGVRRKNAPSEQLIDINYVNVDQWIGN